MPCRRNARITLYFWCHIRPIGQRDIPGRRIRNAWSGGEKEKPMVCSSETSRSDLGRQLILERAAGGKPFCRCLFLWCGEHADDYRRLTSQSACRRPKAGYTRTRNMGPYADAHWESRFSVIIIDRQWVMRRQSSCYRADI